MKNAHGVEPTRFKKREESRDALYCDSYCGPVFCGDICIRDNCNKEDSCFIDNDGTHGYECHSEYKSSLYVNTNEPDYVNYFSVLDYEVYTYN